jgi:hypothetical protein
MEKRILLENCFLPGDLKRLIEVFVEHTTITATTRASTT